jgi:pyrimidine-nucleoside phosphorylase
MKPAPGVSIYWRPMRAVDLIRTKRDGGTLDADAIRAFVAGVTDGSWPDYQISALLMAIVWRGMSLDEASVLTDAMVRSGVRVDLSAFSGTPVDKHSTGGVGDKTSLVLAPLAAACGAIVPMMSGRGLGHTGGTLDKLEAIPGFRTRLSLDEMRAALVRCGCALIGQTDEIAPADRRLYALRDVTGTVESIPLICASILSKKIAEGIGALVLDVKVGKGAFMKTEAEARQLASWLAGIAERSGVRTQAMLTPMEVPLGRAVGNANEVIESIETLKRQGPADLEALSVRLAARMLVLSRVASDEADAQRRVRQALDSGAGLEKFREIVASQGGDPRVIDDYNRLPTARLQTLWKARRGGVVARLDAELIGRAAVALGAGRDRADAGVDPAAGITIVAPVGAKVDAGDAVLVVSCDDPGRLAAAEALLADAVTIADEAPPPSPLVIDIIDGKDVRLQPMACDEERR